MSLILAIEPDQRQAAQLAELIRGRLHADLVHARTTEDALTALAGIGDRVPDLVLVPSLLSAQEDAAIAGALRMIAVAANVQMLTIPRLADPEQPPQHRGVFAKLRGRKSRTAPKGCEPAVFADQIASYLAEAAAERRAQQAEDDLVDPVDAVSIHGSLTPETSEPWAERVAEEFATTVLAPDEVIAAPVFAAADTPVDPPIFATVNEPIIRPIVEPIVEPIVRPIVKPVVHEIVKPAVEAVAESIPQPAPEPIFESIVDPMPVAEAPATMPVLEVYAPLILGPPPPPAETYTSVLFARPDLRPVEEIEPVVLAASADPMIEPTESHVAAAPFIVVAEDVPAAIASASAELAAASDESRLVATVEDSAVVAEPVAEPVAGPAPTASRRRRKAARPPAPKTEDTFDVDALLAPLLSELAAKRTLPGKREKPRVAASVEETAPAAAVPVRPPSEVARPPVGAELPPPPKPVYVEPVAPVHRVKVPEPVIQVEPAASTKPVVAVKPVVSVAPVSVAPAVPIEPAVSVQPVMSKEPVVSIEPAIAMTPAVPVRVDEPVVTRAALEPDIDPMFFAEQVHAGTTDPAPHDRPAWVELIESLRKDIERLKAEQRPAAEQPSMTSRVVETDAEPPRIGRILSIAPAPRQADSSAPVSKIRQLATRARAPKPVQDQWGLFDPEQCGFAALRAKLDEISAREEASA